MSRDSINTAYLKCISCTLIFNATTSQCAWGGGGGISLSNMRHPCHPPKGVVSLVSPYTQRRDKVFWVTFGLSMKEGTLTLKVPLPFWFFEVKSYHMYRNQTLKSFLHFCLINLHIINCKDQGHSHPHVKYFRSEAVHINQNSCTDFLGTQTKKYRLKGRKVFRTLPLPALRV